MWRFHQAQSVALPHSCKLSANFTDGRCDAWLLAGPGMGVRALKGGGRAEVSPIARATRGLPCGGDRWQAPPALRERRGPSCGRLTRHERHLAWLDGRCRPRRGVWARHGRLHRFLGATCHLHAGGAWPTTLASMVIDVPVGSMGTLQVSGKTIIQGIPSNTSVDPTSRTLLPYRLQVGVSGGSGGGGGGTGTGTGALALRHVSARA